MVRSGGALSLPIPNPYKESLIKYWTLPDLVIPLVPIHFQYINCEATCRKNTTPLRCYYRPSRLQN